MNAFQKMTPKSGVTEDVLSENGLLFHGTSEDFEGSLRASALDSVVWFADSPAVAQSYLYESGSEALMTFPRHRLDDKFVPTSSLDEVLLNAFGIDVDSMEITYRHGGIYSYRTAPNHPTYRDVQSHLEEMGYEFVDESAWLKIELQALPAESRGSNERSYREKILPADHREVGRLFIARRPRDLKLYDLESSADGGLSGRQWRYHDLFQELSSNPNWDGVCISDINRSKSLGHFSHRSYGLFERTVMKMEMTAIPCQYHDPGYDEGGFCSTAAFPPK